MAAPDVAVCPALVRLLRQWNETARRLRHYELAEAFKGMARQAGPDDVEVLLDEVLILWQEARRGKLWELADAIRTGLQTLPGLIFEERGGNARWRFGGRDDASP